MDSCLFLSLLHFWQSNSLSDLSSASASIPSPESPPVFDSIPPKHDITFSGTPAAPLSIYTCRTASSDTHTQWTPSTSLGILDSSIRSSHILWAFSCCDILSFSLVDYMFKAFYIFHGIKPSKHKVQLQRQHATMRIFNCSYSF